jgi:predicted signal transduction protein with EAL and GGDEF domain
LTDLSKDTEPAALQTQLVGEKIMTALTQPYVFDDYEFECSASVGIRMFREHDNVDELLRHAHIAMYQAKSCGGKTLCFFDPMMQTWVNERANLEKNLRHALEQNQFQLYFQSQVNGQGHIIGAEVLLCWQNPMEGMIMPNQFIDLAEITGLILPIGRWVLETACAQLKCWKESVLTQHLQLAINVSICQFRQPDFVGDMERIVDLYKIRPDLLKLELTESVVLDNINHTVDKMLQLKSRGFFFRLMISVRAIYLFPI